MEVHMVPYEGLGFWDLGFGVYGLWFKGFRVVGFRV